MHKKNQKNDLIAVFLVPLILALAMWVVYRIDKTNHLKLYEWGIFPRDVNSLAGILLTPLIHSTRNPYHILENTTALLFFAPFLYYFYKNIATKVLVFSWLITNALVWCFAKEAYHVGMSGVIYSIAFYLITGSLIRKNRELAGLNALIIFLYGSIVWGLFPIMPQVSWESHLMGALTGIGIALYYRKYIPEKVVAVQPIEDDPNDDADDAWWKTGVIKEEPKENANFTIHYELRPNEPDKNKKQ